MRIAGITIPDDKHLEYALTVVYGIGLARSQQILDGAKIDRIKKASELSADDEKKIRQAVETFTIEGDLKREKSGNIKRLKDVKAYRGVRHSKSLKVRGQRSKSNHRVVPGGVSAQHRGRKTAGSGKRKVEKK